MDSWSSVLDEMERRLEHAGRAFDAGEFGFDPVAVPPDLGPLPQAQRQRAEKLYQATLDLERRVEVAMAGVEEHLGRRSFLAPSRPQPTYVDRRA